MLKRLFGFDPTKTTVRTEILAVLFILKFIFI